MRHAVEDVIESHAEGHRGKRLRIVRIVRPLPRIAQVHIVADSHHDSPFVIADGAPLRLIAILLIGVSGANPLLAWNLHLVVDVIERVKYLVAALKVFDW